MATTQAEKPSIQSNPTNLDLSSTGQGIVLKRTVTVKTEVTDTFREQAKGELSQELKLIDSQLDQLDAQYQQTLQQLESLAQQGRNVSQELDQLNAQAQEKRQQLSRLKMEMTHQLANLDKIPNGTFIVTGSLENFVQVKVGDNLYEKIRGAEIIVQNGLVKSIQG